MRPVRPAFVEIAGASFTLNSDDEITTASNSTGGLNNSYSYDTNGEQTGRTLAGTAYTLAYDYDGQLTSVTQGSATTSFAYDAAGRRDGRTAGSTTTAFQYAGDAVLLEKQGSSTTATYSYGNALIRKDGEYPLCDGLGSARAETSSSQAVTFAVNTNCCNKASWSCARRLVHCRANEACPGKWRGSRELL